MDCKKMPRVAWMGGCKPKPLEEVSEEERALIQEYLDHDIRMYRWFWGEEPDQEIRDQYLVGARYDAHATLRECTA